MMKIVTPAQLKVAQHADKDQLKLSISGILVDAESQEVAATNGHVLVRIKPSAEQLKTQAPNIDAVMPKSPPKAVATFNGRYLQEILKTFSQATGKEWASSIVGPHVQVELWTTTSPARLSMKCGDGSEITALIMPLRVHE